MRIAPVMSLYLGGVIFRVAAISCYLLSIQKSDWLIIEVNLIKLFVGQIQRIPAHCFAIKKDIANRTMPWLSECKTSPQRFPEFFLGQ